MNRSLSAPNLYSSAKGYCTEREAITQDEPDSHTEYVINMQEDLLKVCQEEIQPLLRSPTPDSTTSSSSQRLYRALAEQETNLSTLTEVLLLSIVMILMFICMLLTPAIIIVWVPLTILVMLIQGRSLYEVFQIKDAETIRKEAFVYNEARRSNMTSMI